LGKELFNVPDGAGYVLGDGLVDAIGNVFG
jgi:hypothetical protein